MKASLAALALVCAASGARADLGARTNYLERCGGCHGIDGRSASALVPDLKDRAGYFLCNDEAREYAGRLPNVVFSQISDEEMAALLNYVVFRIGAGSAPPGARGYTAEDAARMREAPLAEADLRGLRARIVARLVTECGAPDALRTEYGAER